MSFVFYLNQADSNSKISKTHQLFLDAQHHPLQSTRVMQRLAGPGPLQRPVWIHWVLAVSWQRSPSPLLHLQGNVWNFCQLAQTHEAEWSEDICWTEYLGVSGRGPVWAPATLRQINNSWTQILPKPLICCCSPWPEWLFCPQIFNFLAFLSGQIAHKGSAFDLFAQQRHATLPGSWWR